MDQLFTFLGSRTFDGLQIPIMLFGGLLICLIAVVFYYTSKLKQERKQIEIMESEIIKIQDDYRSLSSNRDKILTDFNELKQENQKLVEQMQRTKDYSAEVKGLKSECEKLKSEITRIINTEVKVVKKGSQEKKNIVETEKDKFEREKRLLLNSIGVAKEADKEDLRQVRGIGPFIEKKLHLIGVYTIKQVSKFTKEDVERATKLIKFFPGRIERDNWVFQAKEIVRVRERKLDTTKRS